MSTKGIPPATVIGSKDGALQQVVRTVRIARGEIRETLVNSLNFAMGSSWMGFSKVVAGETFLQDPGDADAPTLWGLALASACILVPAIGLAAMRCGSLVKRADAAMFQGDHASALALRVSEKGLRKVCTSGFAFVLASQLNGAVSASVPREPWHWRAVYVLLLFVAVSCLSTGAALAGRNGRCAGSRAHLVASETIVGGSAYMIALGFFELASAALGLEEVGSSEDLGFLALFAAITIIVATAALAALAWYDEVSAGREGPELRRAWESDDVVKMAARSQAASASVDSTARTLAGKVASLAAVVALYTFVYVCFAKTSANAHGGALDRASVYDPLELWGAALFLLLSICCAVAGGGVLEFLLRRLKLRLAEADPDLVEGSVDDVMIDALEAVAATTLKTVGEAFSWLVGGAMNAFVGSVWAAIFFDGGDDVVAGAIVALCYSIAISSVAISTTLFCMVPKPSP